MSEKIIMGILKKQVIDKKKNTWFLKLSIMIWFGGLKFMILNMLEYFIQNGKTYSENFTGVQ